GSQPNAAHFGIPRPCDSAPLKSDGRIGLATPPGCPVPHNAAAPAWVTAREGGQCDKQSIGDTMGYAKALSRAALAAAIVFTLSAGAAVKMPGFFSDHMVLQRGMAV